MFGLKGYKVANPIKAKKIGKALLQKGGLVGFFMKSYGKAFKESLRLGRPVSFRVQVSPAVRQRLHRL